MSANSMTEVHGIISCGWGCTVMTRIGFNSSMADISIINKITEADYGTSDWLSLS